MKLNKRHVVVALRIIAALGFILVAISPRPPIWGQRSAPVWQPPSQEAIDQKQDDAIENLIDASKNNREAMQRLRDKVAQNALDIAALRATNQAQLDAASRREVTTTIATSGSGLMVLGSILVPLLPPGKRRRRNTETSEA